MKKELKKIDTTFKFQHGSFTLNYYTDTETFWIPLYVILDIFDVTKKKLQNYTGKHMIKKIEFKNIKVECIDGIALLKCNKLFKDEIFYASLMKLVIWKKSIWFDIQDILTIVPKIKGTMDSLSVFSANVNYYNRVKTDEYHSIENTDKNTLKHLKLCLEKRRIQKIKYGLAELLYLYFNSVKIEKFINSLKALKEINKSKVYRSRLTHEEQVKWRLELSSNELI